MIIDLILDRKDEEEQGIYHYRPHDFYFDVLHYGKVGDGITLAMDYGEEEDVKRALCEYIERNEYNPEIKKYIMSRRWL